MNDDDPVERMLGLLAAMFVYIALAGIAAALAWMVLRMVFS